MAHRRSCEQRGVSSLACHRHGRVVSRSRSNRTGWSDRDQVSAKCGVVWVDRWGPSGANVRKACTPAMMAIRITGRVRSLCSWRALTRWLQARTALSSNTKSAVRLLRRGLSLPRLPVCLLVLRSLGPVDEDAASVARRRRRPTPDPWAGTGVEVAGRDSCGQGDLAGVGGAPHAAPERHEAFSPQMCYLGRGCFDPGMSDRDRGR
jgi:hypothetical protein